MNSVFKDGGQRFESAFDRGKCYMRDFQRLSPGDEVERTPMISHPSHLKSFSLTPSDRTRQDADDYV